MMIAYLLHQVWILQNEFHWELSSLAMSQGFSVSVITDIHMCKSLQTRRHTQRYKGQLHNEAQSVWDTTQEHTNMSTETEWSGCFDTHHVRHHTVCPSFWKVTLYDTSRLSHHTPFPFKPSHLQPPCHHASRSHTPQWRAAKSRRLLLSPSPSQTEWGKFTLAFFLFFPRWSVRQLLWWWDTKTALAANAHMSGKIIEFVFASVCVSVCNA